MADTRLKIKPGVEIQSTPYQTGSGLNDSQLIRHHQGYIQKLGGWARLSNTATSGTPRGMHTFLDLNSIGYVAFGTEQKLCLLNDTTIYDITPLASTVNLTAPFTTVSGESTVKVTDVGHGAAVGDWIEVATAAYVNGITLQGPYEITEVVDANNYKIETGITASGSGAGGTTFAFTTANGDVEITFSLGSATFATGDEILVYVATTTGTIVLSGYYTLTSPTTFDAASAAVGIDNDSENGGDVRILYYLATSTDPSSPYVYSGGYYGMGYYGVGTGQTGEFYLRQWSLQNWGQVLLAAPWKGPIYQWTPPTDYDNRATLVGSDSPDYNTQILIAMPQRQVVSFGSDAGGYLDPLLIRWSDVDDYSSAGAWTAATTNQAGSFRLSRGSRIVGVRQSSTQILIWTDVALWSMQYIQPPLIYGFNEIGLNCGLVAMRASAEIGGTVIWMGHSSFFRFNGNSVEPLRCSVWDFVFPLLDIKFGAAIHAMPNSDFTEITWYFPTAGSNGIPTRFVKYNIAENLWDKGELTRTAGVDRSEISAPIGAEGDDGYLQEHEASVDADGAAMDAWFETGLIPIDDGAQNFMHLDRMFPDFKLATGSTVYVTVTMYDSDAQDATGRVYGPFTVTSTTQFFKVDGRGKFAQLRIESSDLGSFWRVGDQRVRSAPAGRAGG